MRCFTEPAFQVLPEETHAGAQGHTVFRTQSNIQDAVFSGNNDLETVHLISIWNLPKFICDHTNLSTANSFKRKSEISAIIFCNKLNKKKK